MCGFELEMNTKNGIDNGVDDGVCGCVACDVHDTIRVVVFTTYYLYVVLYILVSLDFYCMENGEMVSPIMYRENKNMHRM